MNILPYEEFMIQVNLPPKEVCQRLLTDVSEQTNFKGDVHDRAFKIHRSIGYRNSGLPILLGELEEIEGGTMIKVKMRLHRLIQLFLLIWIAMEVNFIIQGIENYMEGLIMIVAGCAIVYLGFWFEARKSKTTLIELYERNLASDHKAMIKMKLK